MINHDGVVDHQINGDQGLDLLRIFAHVFRNVAHSGKISKQGHAGKILQHNPCDNKGNFVNTLCGWPPVGEFFNVVLAYFFAITVAQH